MKKITIFLIFLLSINYLYSQHKFIFNSSRIEVKRVYNNDTIFNKLDTCFIMNKKTFKLYNDDYYEIFDELKNTYENRIYQQDNEYTLLKIQYDELSSNSGMSNMSKYSTFPLILKFDFNLNPLLFQTTINPLSSGSVAI